VKKISTLTVVAILFSASVIHAQIQKGLFFTGGNIGGSIQKAETYSNYVL